MEDRKKNILYYITAFHIFFLTLSDLVIGILYNFLEAKFEFLAETIANIHLAFRGFYGFVIEKLGIIRISIVLIIFILIYFYFNSKDPNDNKIRIIKYLIINITFSMIYYIIAYTIGSIF